MMINQPLSPQFKLLAPHLSLLRILALKSLSLHHPMNISVAYKFKICSLQLSPLSEDYRNATSKKNTDEIPILRAFRRDSKKLLRGTQSRKGFRNEELTIPYHASNSFEELDQCMWHVFG